MPHYQVEYSYDVPQFATITVEAENFEAAEDLAVQSLNYDRGELNKHYFIESIEEVKNVA